MSALNSYLGALLNLPVTSNMRHNPPTVSPLDPVSKVIESFMKQNIGAVIVVENNQPVGIITEKDILIRVVNAGSDFDKTIVKDVMTEPLISIEAESSLKEALEVIREHKIRRLIVTEKGTLRGLTTERRMLEVAHERYVMRNQERMRRLFSDEIDKPMVSFVSTYPPRECGIATYTSHLVDAIMRLYVLGQPAITAINDKGGYYDYSNWVKFQIQREEVESYIDVAKKINESDVDIVNLQHEFGLFGGQWGEHVISFLEELEKPVVTTLHTILQEPSPYAKKVLKEILDRSEHVVSMARVGLMIMEQLYDTFADKVRYIPHGCPNVPFIGSGMVKKHLGLKDRVVLSTFGLLSRGKGIEYAIEAIPQLAEYEPKILYLIIGETHPEVRKHEGETYRQRLSSLVEELGVEDNIKFVNRFLEKNELIRFLQATDIYIIPYPNREQISSGTLLYALSTGKAIVSTPFLHAEEVISEGCATQCEFKNPGSIADSVETLLRIGDIRKRYEERAYQYSRNMIWPNVAMKYVNLFYEVFES